MAAEQPIVRPSPVTYDVKTTPWPAKPKAPPTSSAFADHSFAAPSAPPRTVYYKKDTNAPVKPWAAAELTRPVGAQEPGKPATEPEAPDEPLIPSGDRLFRLDAEKQLQQFENERRAPINAKIKADPTIPEKEKKLLPTVEFPAQLPIAGAQGAFPGRFFAQHQSTIEPSYVCHRRLFFEDRNTERYGWTLGPLQPFASTWKFYGDIQKGPYKFFSFPCVRHECSAGLCLPGDPVPAMIYPPGLSLTGALAQAGVTVALYAIVP